MGQEKNLKGQGQAVKKEIGGWRCAALHTPPAFGSQENRGVHCYAYMQFAEKNDQWVYT